MTEPTAEIARHPLVGKIVRDVSADVWPEEWVPHYAIGQRGFLDLHNCWFVAYDSAFPGPEFFDRPEFLVVSAAITPHAPTDAGGRDE